MILNFIPSLLHMASVKIASYLLQDSDIRELLHRGRKLPYRYNCFDSDTYELWILLEKIAVEKLSDLPPNLPNKAAKLIRPMHCEMYAWITDNDLPCGDENITSYMKFLEWKTDGTIDGEKTAKKLLQRGNLPYRECFVIACNYCLKDEILSLWNRKKWWFRFFGVNSITERRTNAAIRLWIHLLKEENTEPVNEIVEQFLGIQYFDRTDIPLRLSCYFPYLSQAVRCNILLNYSKLHNQDIHLCLYQMGEVEQMEFLQSDHIGCLAKCLDWPCEDLFINAAKEVMTHLTVKECRCILAFIIVYYILRDCNYVKVFKLFWKIIPVSYQDEMKKNQNEFNSYQLILNCDEDCQSKLLFEEVDKYFPFQNFYMYVNANNYLCFRGLLSMN